MISEEDLQAWEVNCKKDRPTEIIWGIKTINWDERIIALIADIRELKEFLRQKDENLDLISKTILCEPIEIIAQLAEMTIAIGKPVTINCSKLVPDQKYEHEVIGHGVGSAVSKEGEK